MQEMYDMDHNAGTVQGILAIILRMSRMVGGAPLHFGRVRGGYNATISRPAAIYGCILTFCAHLCLIIATYVNIMNSYKQGERFSVGTILINVMVMIVTGIGSYASISRMRRMFNHLDLLHKINYNINGSLSIKQNKKLCVTISSYIILWAALFAVTTYLTFQRTNLLAEVLNILFTIEHFKMLLLEMEHAVIHFDIYFVLREISMKLRNLIDETNTDNVSPACCYLMSKRVQDLTKSYVAICDLVVQLNAARGFILYILFSSTILCLMFTICNLIDTQIFFSGGIVQDMLICIQLLWCGIHLFRTVLFIEPWHKIQEEVTALQLLLSQLMINVTSLWKSIPLQLDLMYKHLLLIEPTMSPLQLFTFQRPLLTTAVGFVTTYLVLLIQCLNDRWN